MRLPRSPFPTALVLLLAGSIAAGGSAGAEPTPGAAARPKAGPTPPCPVDFEAPFLDGPAAWHEEPVAAPRKQEWERRLGGKEAARAHVRARLRAWPDRLLAERADLPAGGRPLLERIARDTWRGIDAFTDRENGLPVDNVRVGSAARDAPSASAPGAEGDYHVGDYTNVTNVGLYLIDVVAAHELGFLTRDEARGRLEQVLDTMGRLETHAGYFYNFYDTTSLERTSNFLSFVDLSWLSAGLMVARQAFPEVAERATPLVERMGFGFFYDARRGQMSHGFYANRGVRSHYHYGVLYTEARLGVLLAIGRGEVPEDAWFRMARIFPASCQGQTLEPQAVERVSVRGHEIWTGYYDWQGFRYVPSWGGSMFEALMPTVVLDEPRLAPRSLGANDRVHAAVQERYAAGELGYPVWGISPSATPDGEGYREFGVRVLGSRGYRAGAVTPHATALALVVRPEAATEGLRRLIDAFPIYGDLGFYDAVDPKSGEVAYTYLTLDQSLLFLAVANRLSGGAIQRHFAADPIVERIVPLLREETYFD